MMASEMVKQLEGMIEASGDVEVVLHDETWEATHRSAGTNDEAGYTVEMLDGRIVIGFE